MAVSRYDNPARYTPVDDYVKFPIEFLASALATKQASYDKTEATNESSLKAIRDLVVLDKVRTNTGTTETVDAVDKQIKQAFIDKTNKQIADLTESVNGDLGSSDAGRKAKAIADEVNAFKADFGVKAKTRYDNYTGTMKQLDATKVDPAAIQQGIFNQVNQSLSGDYNNFDKSYTSNIGEYHNMEENLDKQLQKAASDVTSSVGLMGVEEKSKLWQSLGRTGVYKEEKLIETLTDKKIRPIVDNYWLGTGKAIAQSTADAQVYNNGRVYKSKEEYNDEVNSVYKRMLDGALTKQYSKVKSDKSFNPDPNSSSGGKDKDGELLYLPSKEGDNIQLQRDGTGEVKKIDIETVNQDLLNKDLKIAEVKKQLKNYPDKTKREAKALTSTLVQLEAEKINEQLRAKTAQQTVLRTKLPEIMVNSNILKNTKINPDVLNDGLSALYGTNFRLPIEKNMQPSKGRSGNSWDEVQDGYRVNEALVSKALQNPAFKKMWDELDNEIKTEDIQKIGRDGKQKTVATITSADIKKKKFAYLKQLSDGIEEESGKMLTKYANLVGQEVIINADILDKTLKDKVSKLAKNEIATLGASDSFTKNEKGEHDTNVHEFVPDNAVLGLDGEHIFFNTNVIGKDKLITEKKKVYLNKPSKALVNSLIESALAQPTDLLLNSRISLFVNPILRELPLKPNGAVLPNGKQVSGITYTPDFDNKKVQISKIKSHPNPTSPDESLYTINDDTDALTFQELTTIILHRQFAPEPEPSK